MLKQDLPLNKPQVLIGYKTQPSQNKTNHFFSRMKIKIYMQMFFVSLFFIIFLTSHKL